MHSADYLRVRCISVFIGARLFLSISEERHDEVENPLQIGQKRDQSAAAPSVLVMTTWLLGDVTRLAGEALQTASSH